MDLGHVLATTSALTQGLATRRGLARNGVSQGRLSRAVAAGELVRVRRCVYAARPLPPLPRFVVTHEGVTPEYVQHVRAVLMSLGGSVAACGRTAAALYGWAMLVEPSRTVEVAVRHGHGSVSPDGVRVVQRRTATFHRHVALRGTAGLRMTTAVQTVLDCAAQLPLVQAVVIADSALRAGDVSLAELRRAAASARGTKDAAKVRRVLELCDPESGSVLESVLRVRMVLSGITGFGSQVVLRHAPVLRVDFCFVEAGLVVEADGAKWHPDPSRDQARDNALAGLGWRVLRYSWGDVVHDSARVLDEISAAVSCAGPALPGAQELAA